VEQGRTFKGILESKSEGSRSGRREKSRLSWLEDVDKNLREMRVKKWRQKAVDGEEWASVSKEAKAIRGP